MMRAAILLSLIAMLGRPMAAAQEPVPAGNAQARPAVIDAARELMTKARYCALVTIGPDGSPQARAIDAFAPEQDLTVWMATNPITRKVKDITRNPTVTLYYFGGAESGYVTLLGRAEIVDDPSEKAKHWKEDWARFYSDKNRGADYVLIRIRPRRLEIVSYPHRLLNDPKTWRPIAIEFPEERRVTRVSGTFDVKLTPQGVGDQAEGTSLGRMTIDKTYFGPLAGTGRGEMLSALTPIKDSAGYVAVERVNGALDGQKGTFILQHNGMMTRGAQQLTITVVPDSGTGELAGITGTMTVRIERGKHFYEFEYALR
jgi:general stress protein 26